MDDKVRDLTHLLNLPENFGNIAQVTAPSAKDKLWCGLLQVEPDA